MGNHRRLALHDEEWNDANKLTNRQPDQNAASSSWNENAAYWSGKTLLAEIRPTSSLRVSRI